MDPTSAAPEVPALRFQQLSVPGGQVDTKDVPLSSLFDKWKLIEDRLRDSAAYSRYTVSWDGHRTLIRTGADEDPRGVPLLSKDYLIGRTVGVSAGCSSVVAGGGGGGDGGGGGSIDGEGVVGATSVIEVGAANVSEGDGDGGTEVNGLNPVELDASPVTVPIGVHPSNDPTLAVKTVVPSGRSSSSYIMLLSKAVALELDVDAANIVRKWLERRMQICAKIMKANRLLRG
ncbi:hypothetical protein C8J57DRAFT_1473518 [Mycena rebaudengoi]|nr:hypothetical protein C8J57DRAFT_1473518 [Mycena rebaudengoi]